DHRARERSVSSLRAYVLNNMANAMREDFERHVAGDDLADGPAVHRRMRERDLFRFYSSLRCAAQELVWNSVIDSVNANADQLDERFRTLSGDRSRAEGSLELDPALEKPDYYDAVDVHLMPGNYDGASDDPGLLPGAVYDNGFNVFAFGAMGKTHDDIGWSMANFVRMRFPELNPDVIVDVGCTIGHNTLPWKRTFPDAQVHGLDVAAACLRYAHARAQSMGVTAHFHQRSSDALGFDTDSVDVVFSSMFLHELPKKHIEQFLAEAHRVLKPGGVMIHMELPPNAALSPYDAFYLDWDSYYNNEPFYKHFRDQDYQQLCVDAGFDADAFFQAVMPRYTYVDEAVFREAVTGEAKFDEDTGRLSDDIQWYGFGARKS
ncbi:MAG: class I SAM-dependent methyltransferase, partial [Woeseiaceae bacterium]|nr:class I SAM-dependent methyltransferase [Woeseiaceae bacterium]